MPRELLLYNIESEKFKDQYTIEKYMSDLFYFTSKIKSYEYNFKITKIKSIFYEGTFFIKKKIV